MLQDQLHRRARPRKSGSPDSRGGRVPGRPQPGYAASPCRRTGAKSGQQLALKVGPCKTPPALVRWPSGRRRTLGKRVYGKPYRGFESHLHRQSSSSNCLIKNDFLRLRRAHCLQLVLQVSGVRGGKQLPPIPLFTVLRASCASPATGSASPAPSRTAGPVEPPSPTAGERDAGQGFRREPAP